MRASSAALALASPEKAQAAKTSPHSQEFLLLFRKGEHETQLREQLGGLRDVVQKPLLQPLHSVSFSSSISKSEEGKAFHCRSNINIQDLPPAFAWKSACATRPECDSGRSPTAQSLVAQLLAPHPGFSLSIFRHKITETDHAVIPFEVVWTGTTISQIWARYSSIVSMSSITLGN